MAGEQAVYGPEWPDLSQHWQAGHGRIYKPAGGHTWHGDIDLAGFRYLGTATEEVRRTGSVLIVRLYCLPPLKPLVVEGER